MADKTLTFEDNRLASALFGQFDEHLALLEQKLDVEASARGNHVSLTGSAEACANAAEVLESLYSRLRKGEHIALADVDGAIRVASRSGIDQKPLPGLSGLAQVTTRRRTVTARSANQDAYIRQLEDNDLVFGVGPAGTGKTYIAVAYAAALLERGAVDRLILSRPAVEAGERLGFLPGDMKEKVDPYLRPLYDALYDVMTPERVERGIANQVIEIAPLAFMRGRTLAHAAVILDEAQNCTTMQMKMFLTRLGEGSKMIVTGDPSQIDLPDGQRSGLPEAVSLLEGVESVGQTRFTAQDVVRHPLVQRIVDAYERHSQTGMKS
ncbi:PhoH family protein [Tepidamorphus sp. 3E244]|uniref:PhoH family protein n=1 Tax=Tepidamorphus sp. 3E244 TaxID=3385498 RepID=UPI0038FBE717